MPREFQRSDRVASQIQRELADLLRTNVTDTRLGMVTVSDLEVTRDLAVAKAFVTFLGATGTAEQSLAILNELAPQLRRDLSRRFRIRVMPELRFSFDDSLERGMRMDQLLRDLSTDPPGDPE